MAHSQHIIKPLDGQRGVVAVLFALCLIVLLGVAALAIDVARINLTKVELQGAADAAALAGVRSLTAGGVSPYNWDEANSMATAMAKMNVANGGQNIRDVTIDHIYWNIPTKSWVPVPTPDVPPTGYVPALRATVTIDNTHNSPPLNLFFGNILGHDTQTVSASAIAVISSPGAGKGVFPFGFNVKLLNLYWDNTTNSPKINPSTQKPYTLQIGKGASYNIDGTPYLDKKGKNITSGGPILTGTWTNLSSKSHPGNNIVKDMIETLGATNTTYLKIGNEIWMDPGDRGADYGVTPKQIVTLYAVDNILDTKSKQIIVAIAGFEITDVDIDSKIIYGNLVNTATAWGTNPGNGGAPSRGASTPPFLVQ